ncbi:MAG: ATP-dependent protease subunit HslV [Candidatus Aminicenantes bacterium]|nr:ATP-dependent protease subunit HslV [Candidatus Aminicenantes bacterium]NIM78967.1 ATP-dependent protease subunit HslV [Candidatus Aminicenantes bacterium]NIN18226.1 ATP-dependent protease subunit HslV [Candidatus Aminicenantes bacterium]NIN42123.1 ATP-dependent protease subunit HslV [Candidatus Aminicenantes bacterium]NIN84879.1 ATP-dependent protease subunit HslV [Candidatus Aminicenantes bacterium]
MKTKRRQNKILSTTVLCVKHNDSVVMGADGQVSVGETTLKHGAKKIRRLYNEKVLAGFAGATSDAFSLFQRFEGKLEEYNGNISRAAIELSKEWRTDKVLRRLEAMLIVANNEKLFILSGSGDVIEPDEEVLAIGSGGAYAMAAAVALKRYSNLDARAIVEKAMDIAADICIYTNKKITIEVL